MVIVMMIPMLVIVMMVKMMVVGMIVTTPVIVMMVMMGPIYALHLKLSKFRQSSIIAC